MATVEIPTLEALGVYDTNVPIARFTGYRPTIRWNGFTVWESQDTVPFHHGDYDNDQERSAALIAEKHIVETLKRLFGDQS